MDGWYFLRRLDPWVSTCAVRSGSDPLHDLVLISDPDRTWVSTTTEPDESLTTRLEDREIFTRT